MEDTFPYLDQTSSPFDSLWFPDHVQYGDNKVAEGWSLLAHALAHLGFAAPGTANASGPLGTARPGVEPQQLPPSSEMPKDAVDRERAGSSDDAASGSLLTAPAGVEREQPAPSSPEMLEDAMDQNLAGSSDRDGVVQGVNLLSQAAPQEDEATPMKRVFGSVVAIRGIVAVLVALAVLILVVNAFKEQ